MDEALKRKLAKVKLLALDFDGVLTDGTVYTDQDGREMVRSSRRDSMGTGILQKNGILVVVISTEANPVVTKRCEKINVPCYQKVERTEGKRQILQRIAEEQGLTPDEVAFVGDDVNDLGALAYAGVRMTVADGHDDVKAVCDYIATRRGGNHAVREICDLILAAQGKSPRWQ